VEISLKELGVRVEGLGNQLGTLNAHIENLQRESSKTTHILETEARKREKSEEHEKQLEMAKLQHQIDTDTGSRQAFQNAVASVWKVVKQPLGMVLTAIGTFIVYHYFSTGG
tara:strand:+ start:1449 stop:1784 length:336 start_codon:yes stop_codon:yes gene_type:complete